MNSSLERVIGISHYL